MAASLNTELDRSAGTKIMTEKSTYLFFDTETTGLPKNWKAPVSDFENWPRIVQIAWAQYDESGIRIGFKNYILKPEGFTIPPGAVRVHGITTERAMADGVLAEAVFREFSESVSQSHWVIAHNLDFDEKMVASELLRRKMPGIFQEKDRICTMKKSTNYCRIPGTYGNKWPTLPELHAKLFAVDFKDHHEAGADVLCCAKCFFELKKRGIF